MRYPTKINWFGFIEEVVNGIGASQRIAAGRIIYCGKCSAFFGWACVLYKLNSLLAEAGFDTWIESICLPHYKEKGRPGIPPGVCFRMLLIGYFEGIQSQRGIAWRCADSLSLRKFLGIQLTESTPDHSSLTHLRERLPHNRWNNRCQARMVLSAGLKSFYSNELSCRSRRFLSSFLGFIIFLYWSRRSFTTRGSNRPGRLPTIHCPIAISIARQ